MHVAFLGLGSNQGARLAHLQTAVDGFVRHDAIRVADVSPVYETEAHTADPEHDQPAFLNAVVEVETTLAPEELLRVGQAHETMAGRVPPAERDGWTPRPLDVDVLAVDDVSQETETLVLPHPRLGERRFVLRPWADLAPNFVVPAPFDATVQTLLDRCTDAGAVIRTPYLLTLPSDAGP